MLLRAAEKSGLTSGPSAALAPGRKPPATHDPGKILLDLAVTLALGGDARAELTAGGQHRVGVNLAGLAP